MGWKTALGIAVLFSGLSAGLTVLALKRSEPPPGPPPQDPSVEALRREVLDLKARLDAPPPAPPESPLATEIRALREEVTRLRQAQAVLQAAPAATRPPPQAGSFEALFARLSAPSASYDEKAEDWAEIQKQGWMEQAIAAFEKRAAGAPGSADAQSDLGDAYVQKLMTVPEGPQRGLWAWKADEAYDRALKIDERHWRGRFSKAMALSFWPPVFGKQAEAIRQFEILIGQQEAQAPEEHFAGAYLYMGNLLQGQGKVEEARKAWERGLAIFPQDEELKAKALGP